MITLISFQKSAPDITDLLIPLLGILIVIFTLNTIYEWLKTKPWKKSGIPPPTEGTLQENESHTTTDDGQNSNTNLMNDSLPLSKPIYWRAG
jgi:hypothetical protein